MIYKILVPLDGSSPAESVLPCIQAYAAVTGASITLAHVIAPNPPGIGRSAVVPANHHQWEHPDRWAAAYLARIAQHLGQAGIVTHTHLDHGTVAERLIRLSGEVDLVVMTTHGRTGLGRWVFGSVADAVLRGTSTPILLLRSPAGEIGRHCPPQRILVPLDGSTLAEQALPLATLLGTRVPAELILTRSIDWLHEAVTANTYGDIIGVGSVDLLAHALDAAHAYLHRVSQQLAAQSVSTQLDVRIETPAEAILTTATRQQADLIIMSTHGRGGLSRWAYGSVASRILHASPVPVLLVRARAPVAIGATTATVAAQ